MKPSQKQLESRYPSNPQVVRGGVNAASCEQFFPFLIEFFISFLEQLILIVHRTETHSYTNRRNSTCTYCFCI